MATVVRCVVAMKTKSGAIELNSRRVEMCPAVFASASHCLCIRCSGLVHFNLADILQSCVWVLWGKRGRVQERFDRISDAAGEVFHHSQCKLNTPRVRMQ